MADILLHKKEINYFILSRGLFFIASTLKDYTEAGVLNLHQRISRKLQNLTPCQNKRCSKRCGRDFLQWCQTCQQWREELLEAHSDKKRFESICWKSTESWNWPQDYRTITTLFLTSGYVKTVPDLNFGDLSTALSLWENCNEFLIAPNIIQRLRGMRNSHAHPTKMEVEDSELTQNFLVFSTLLHQGALSRFIERDKSLRELDMIRVSTEVDMGTVKQVLREVSDTIEAVQSDFQINSERQKNLQLQQTHVLQALDSIKLKLKKEKRNKNVAIFIICIVFTLVIAFFFLNNGTTMQIRNRSLEGIDHGCLLHPCYNGGVCLHMKGRFVCFCRQQYTGLQCETMMPRREFSVHGKINSCTSEPD